MEVAMELTPGTPLRFLCLENLSIFLSITAVPSETGWL